jgi:hypothetical protein
MSMFGLPVVRPRAAAPLAALVACLAGCGPGEVRDRFAAVVDAYRATPSQPTESVFLDARRALGPPDGRTVALGEGSRLALRFFREVRDGPGADLRVYEVGEDGAEARISVSAGGETFTALAALAGGPTTDLDLGAAGVGSVSFVLVEGLDDAGTEPGFDLDAVEALH